MASEFTRFISSDIVILLAQRGESRFFVHTDILTLQSKPFRDALAEEFEQATEERNIDLCDWDGATVGQMVEFLYRGYYQYPDPEPLSPEGRPPVQEVVPGTATTAGDELGSCTTRPLTPVSECLQGILLPLSGAGESSVERLARFDPGRYNYAELLLSHAKVYHLAHCKAIDALKTLALRHLLDTLSRMDPVDSANGIHNVASVVSLARYVYQNTDKLQNHDEPLHRLVSHFVAHNFTALMSTPDLAQLLREGGDIVIDVMMNVYRGPSIPQPSISAVHPPISPIRPPISTIRAPTRYISQLCATFDAPSHSPIQELNGSDPKITLEGDNSVWLRAVYTTDPNKACTAFTRRIRHIAHGVTDSLDIGNNRELFPNRETTVKQKITVVALLRGPFCAKVTDIPAKHGFFDGMTVDLSWMGDRDYLYVVWKSVLVA